MEGDILICINNINVRSMSHINVVQVLKECGIDETATIVIQRCTQSSPDKLRVKNKKDISKLYRSKTPTMDSYGEQIRDVNRSKTPVIDNRTQMSKVQNNILENGSSDGYMMTNNSLLMDEYCHRNDNSWMHVSSTANQMYLPTTMYNGVLDSSTGNYISSQSDNYSNNLSKSIQNMSFEHYEMNASKNEVR